MEDALLMDRWQFAFTITYHYLFPQLTMGLALLIVILKGLAIWKKEERFSQGARFWAKIFAINFALMTDPSIVCASPAQEEGY